MTWLHYNLPVLVEKMFPQVTGLDTTEAALVTAVRSLTGVSHHVRLQCRGLSEGLATVGAGEPGALMHSHVGLQVALGGRFVITGRAVVVLHFFVLCFHMFVVQAVAVEFLLTKLTPIFFIIVRGVDVGF